MSYLNSVAKLIQKKSLISRRFLAKLRYKKAPEIWKNGAFELTLWSLGKDASLASVTIVTSK